MGEAARLTGYLRLISWDITPELSLPKNSKSGESRNSRKFGVLTGVQCLCVGGHSVEWLKS